MRIFERVIYKQEISTNLQSSIGPNQFAHKKGHNTTMALFKCQQYRLNWLNKDADSFDFSKAFDFVSHQIVCNKVKLYNINPYDINWIINFLSNRKQRHRTKSHVSAFLKRDGNIELYVTFTFCGNL